MSAAAPPKPRELRKPRPKGMECCRCHRKTGLEQVDGHEHLMACKNWGACLRRVLHITPKDR